MTEHPMLEGDNAVQAAVAAAAACRSDMHHHDGVIAAFAERAFEFARRRIAADGATLGHPRSKADLDAAAGSTVTAEGLGEMEVLRIFESILEPACLSVDFPRYFAYIPAAPTEMSILGDMLVSACSIYGGTWLEGAGAVWAENQALRWLAGLAGLPDGAGGVFVSGGTMGNVSALVAARHHYRAGRPGVASERLALVVGESSHTSMGTAAQVMDVDLVTVPGTKLTGQALKPVLEQLGPRVFAVVATAGSTNLGLVDDIDSVADVCADAGIWMHVDAAYGGAALAAPSARWRFNGIERTDSMIVDPHKWLFAPFDACALLYRDPATGRAAHAQHASYLDLEATLNDPTDWNPSEYAMHLTRRSRGLPFWFSLAAYGSDAYTNAVEACLAVAVAAVAMINASPHLELAVEPELSVVAFRRRGWNSHQYALWSRRMLDTGTAVVVPSRLDGEPIMRMCFVNPTTTVNDVRGILDSMAEEV